LNYKYKIGDKIMGRHIWYGFVGFIAGEVVQQFQGIGNSYIIKLEPNIHLPEGMRSDGLFPISELYAVPFDDEKWKKIKELSNKRQDLLVTAESYYQQALAMLTNGE